MNSSWVGDLPACVSALNWDRKVDLKHSGLMTKQPIKAPSSPPFVWGFRLVSALFPFFVPGLHPGAVLPGRIYGRKRNPRRDPGLVFHNESNPGTRRCLPHKGILFCGLKAPMRKGREVLDTGLVSSTASFTGEWALCCSRLRGRAPLYQFFSLRILLKYFTHDQQKQFLAEYFHGHSVSKHIPSQHPWSTLPCHPVTHGGQQHADSGSSQRRCEVRQWCQSWNRRPVLAKALKSICFPQK